MMRRLLIGLVTLLLVLAVGVVAWYQHFLNRYQVDGEIDLPHFEAPVQVYRDEYGTPYVFADSFADMIRGQGFVAAQDRIVQAELYRRLVSGRTAEVLGPSMLNADIRARVSGYYRAAERHVPLLSSSSRDFLRWYVEGLNAFIQQGQADYPLELSLMGLLPLEPWTVVDALAMYYFGGSIHGRNLRSELLAQALRDELGEDGLSRLRPLDLNPDRDGPPLRPGWGEPAKAGLQFTGLAPWPDFASPLFGSNNWAIAPGKSASGSAIVTNDPHLDSSQLPGFIYPVGLFSPGVNAVGMGMAGLAGLVAGRTDHVAFGVTNAYGDSQDTYLETPDPTDPGRYLEGAESHAFLTRTETIRVKEDGQVRDHMLTVRSTRRGPVISDHAVFGIRSGQLVSARWATAQQQSPEIGINQLLTAGNADELEQAIFAIDLVYFNYVFADTLGNIGHRSSGLVPVRRAGGAEPNPGGAIDNWRGYIPKHEMPGARNPERLWVGTANHDTRGTGYPYFYGSKFAPNYRYQRMIQLLGEADSISAEQSWQMTLDTHNLLAEKLAPVFSAWLAAQEGTRDLASLLDDWDYRDDADSVGATVFHTVYEEVARLTYQDEMSPALYRQFIVDRYFWQQRHDQALLEDRQAWFDDTRTPERESAGDIVVLAGERALALLQDTLGPDSSAWRWGAASRMVFVSPLRREGAGRDLLGGGEYEGRGSSETINRGAYSTERFPYDTRYIAAARMVADMADEEKVMAIIPAGSVARQGHPWMASQLPAYVEGRWIPWWRDRQRIEEHARHRLVLRPLR